MKLPESRRTYTGLFVLPHSCIPIVNGNSLDRNHDKIYNLQKQNKKPISSYTTNITSTMDISYFYFYEHYQHNSSHLEVVSHLCRIHLLLCVDGI